MKFALPLLAALAAAPASATSVWDEDADGDLSSNANAPTPIVFQLGANTITGSVQATADIRDYITFIIPSGMQLTSILLQRYVHIPTGNPAGLGFHAINLGSTSFVPSVTTSDSFLGGDHVSASQVGTDMLPNLAAAPLAGVGFTAPLGPGTYSYLIQQTGTDLTGYTLDFVLVPTPGGAALFALASFSALRRRQRAPAEGASGESR